MTFNYDLQKIDLAISNYIWILKVINSMNEPSSKMNEHNF